MKKLLTYLHWLFGNPKTHNVTWEGYWEEVGPKLKITEQSLYKTRQTILAGEHRDPEHYPAHRISSTSKDCPICLKQGFLPDSWAQDKLNPWSNQEIF